MDYVFKCSFAKVPECNQCMLAFSKMSTDGETRIYCAALGNRPKCADDGHRQDCPLKPI